MKTCSKCKIEKPFDDFYKQHKSKDGCTYSCKKCIRERTQELKKSPLMQLEKQIRSSILLENKLLAREGKKLCTKCKEIFLISEMSSGIICHSCARKQQKEARNTDVGKLKNRLKGKKYYENNKEYIKQKSKEYIENNRDKINEYQREYNEKNKDKLSEYNREYKEKNKDKMNEYQKEWREKNRDKINKLQREYNEKNKDKKKEYDRRYYLKKKLEKEKQISK